MSPGGSVRRFACFVCIAGTVLACGACAPRHDSPRPRAASVERIAVAPDGRGFVLSSSGRPFVPWGFNYDHDENGRLIEAYWDAEWPKVAEDIGELAALGANVVRIHLQLGRFMRSPSAPDGAALERLGRLLELAECRGLYLDLTGLGCYLESDIPPWYDALDEGERWRVQTRFWEAVAARCAASPAVFCYDLMNEPVVPGEKRGPGEWLAPPFAGKYHYVQFITLDPAGRKRDAVALDWVRRMTVAIRKHDPGRLITVAPLNWCLERPGRWSGFVPAEIAPELDFLSVHLYPESARIEAELEILAGLNVGKPVVVEELFPLRCSPAELAAFIGASRQHAAGWISFYWGRTPSECRQSEALADQLVAAWLDEFRTARPAEPE